MKIILKDLKNNKEYIDKQVFNNEYEVFAIVQMKKDKFYLIFINGQLQFVNVKICNIVDETMPKDWVIKYFNKGYTIKQHYDIFGYDYITIKEYYGPKIFINDKYFLFNVYFNPSEANKFFNNKYLNYKINNNELSL